jgi:hypothetical protein
MPALHRYRKQEENRPDQDQPQKAKDDELEGRQLFPQKTQTISFLPSLAADALYRLRCKDGIKMPRQGIKIE